MTDTTPVTDDDRIAHQWESKNRNHISASLAAVARAIRAHVPAPPKSLADEIRDICKKYSGDVEVDLEPLADRAEAVEKENRDTDRVLNEAWAERDEARDEVIRLTAQVTTQKKMLRAAGVEGMVIREPDADLPDPADVPEGEAWIAEVRGERRIGFRCDPDSTEPWYFPPVDRPVILAGDQHVTLVARLVPDTRRVIDTAEGLDALPDGSLIWDHDDGEQCFKVNGRWVPATPSEIDPYPSFCLVPATLLYEPMVDSTPRS